MATQPLRCIEVAEVMGGGTPYRLTFPEAASQTFRCGALVQLNSSGYLQECAGTDPTSILGVAAEPGHNAATNGASTCGVYVANSETVFLGNMVSAASDLRDVGKSMGVLKDATTNTWGVDKGDLANTRAIVLALDSRDTVGDTNHRVLFQIKTANRQLATTS